MMIRPAMVVLSVAALGVFGCASPKAPISAENNPPAARPVMEPVASHEALPPAPSVAPKVAEQRRFYRLDFVLTANDGSKPATSSSYSLTLEEENTGEIHQGRNVPLQVAPISSASVASVASRPSMASPRQDVGFVLRCSFSSIGEEMNLRSNLEMSSSSGEPVATIQKLSLKGNALVSPGKSVIVSSSEDPSTHQRYQLSVTATRLR